MQALSTTTPKHLVLQFASFVMAMFIAFKLPADYPSLGLLTEHPLS
jgi:hypothetical protein